MVLTSEQMRFVEAKSVELGLSWLRLMENAGSAAARTIREAYQLDNKKVVIICGKGNNGGDGYVIARKLIENKAQIRIISLGAPTTPSAVEMASKAYNLGIKPIDFESYEQLCCQYINDADIIIDAMFGTGLKNEPTGISISAINAVNNSTAKKVAIDIPSGINSDTGHLNGIFVKADLTITFAAYKPCHLLYPACEFCGDVTVATIGIPDAAFASVDPVMQVVTEDFVAAKLPCRTPSCHKGDCGTLGLVCGSLGFAGAAAIAAKAAVKSGVGIADLIVPNCIYNIVSTLVPEAVCTVLKDHDNDTVNDQTTEQILQALDKCDVGLIGCGLGQSRQAKYNVTEILKNLSIPLVIDADGINILSDSIELIKQYTNDVVITPHPKEASRILKCSVDDIQNDRLGSVKKIAKLTNAITVLKGAKTLIGLPNGNVFVVTDGNAGMATAGTGDMLSGIISAFIAQGLTACDSAICAVKVHALSGDIAVKKTSILSLTPTDMIEALSDVYCRIYLMK